MRRLHGPPPCQRQRARALCWSARAAGLQCAEPPCSAAWWRQLAGAAWAGSPPHPAPLRLAAVAHRVRLMSVVVRQPTGCATAGPAEMRWLLWRHRRRLLLLLRACLMLWG